MIEKRILESWKEIFGISSSNNLPTPGRRAICDFACGRDGALHGFDVKTKDLDRTKYSDGGVYSVANLLKFPANDGALFVVVEFGHVVSASGEAIRELNYIKAAPIHLLPKKIYRLENLGTGQIRLNQGINEIHDELEWNRSMDEFFDILVDLAIDHYQKVGSVAGKRAAAMRRFREGGYGKFEF